MAPENERHKIVPTDRIAEDRLYNHLTERRIVLSQFLSQFDPLHSQHCTPNQLVRALSEAGAARVRGLHARSITGATF
jgi:hypothetical protein